ncbi:MAG: hypothetical protein ACTMHL_07180 [Janibacter sp.]
MSQSSRPHSIIEANQSTPRAAVAARALLAVVVVVPLVVFALLFMLPATRPTLSAHPGIAAAVLTAVLVAAVAPVMLLLRRLHGQSEARLGRSRGAWAAAHGWRYRQEERLIAPDVLSEVDPAVTRPVPVRFEADGSWRDRAAFLQSRDSWVWIRASLSRSRRTVTGVRSQIRLPRVVMITDLNRAAAHVIHAHPAAGLQRIPGPDGTRMVLWTPFGLERVVLDALRPVLPIIDRGVGSTEITVVCAGSWVLISAEFDADAATVERRLDAAVEVAAALERGAPRR